MRRNWLVFTILLIGLAALWARATDRREELKGFLRNFFLKLSRVDSIRDSRRKESELMALVSRDIDLDWIANFILGRHGKGIDGGQRRQFIELYSKYLASSYGSTLSIYRGNNYEFVSVEKQREGIFLVSTVVQFNDKKVKNSFRIVEKDGKFHITDVMVEGISFIAAKRADLNSIIVSKGFDGFLEELRMKNGSN
ncbi:MAG: ABC transporter substrate-binding protein [Rickettsiales bacterium]|jgi:phospholipid transport system substrate-binding protein|nr:ABC transporter substrate-binding protein [Rickettsiales bacterium]